MRGPEHGSHDPGPDEMLFPGLRRRRRSPGGGRLWAVLGGVLVLGGLALWLWLRPGPDPASAPLSPIAADQTATGPEIEPDPNLPPLEGSDAFVRDLVARLSSHPQLAAWLVTDDLIHRFVGAVVHLAGGSSPASQLPFLEPDAEFTVERSGGRLFPSRASYRRYDLLTETFVSLDTEGTVRLYRQLLPLLDEAHTELGFPEGTFHATLEDAIENLLAVEVPDEPPEVVQNEAIYEFRDTRIEDRPEAEKHLLRAGPENARRIQDKLTELYGAAGFRTP